MCSKKLSQSVLCRHLLYLTLNISGRAVSEDHFLMFLNLNHLAPLVSLCRYFLRSHLFSFLLSSFSLPALPAL